MRVLPNLIFYGVIGYPALLAVLLGISLLIWRNTRKRIFMREPAYDGVGSGVITGGKYVINCGKLLGRNYYFYITYEYEVCGIKYEGQDYIYGRVGEHKLYLNRADGDLALQEAYPVGKLVTVHYQEGNAGKSYVLEEEHFAQQRRELKGYDIGGWLLIILGVLLPFIVYGLVTFVLGLF